MNCSGGHQSALDFLYGRINYERTANMPYRARELKLQRMQRLLELLGSPDRELRIVHIAGTKGKGSTAAMLAAMLAAAGYRTGVYSSPHLERIEERLVVDGAICTSTEWTALVEQVRPVVERMDAEVSAEGGRGPTYYDILTAMAMLHFAQSGVEFAVVEVGLGGRLDSTNVCRPLVSVITSISYDHTQQLGATLELIAREKAGIIKPGIPVVSGVMKPGPASVIERRAEELGCRLLQTGREFSHTYHAGGSSLDASAAARFDFHERVEQSFAYEGLTTRLLGRHQAANAAVAVASVRELERQGHVVGEAAIRNGLVNAWLPARVEVLGRDPAVVLDCAHNVASIEALLDTLGESFPAQRRRCIFAGSRDKDIRGMLTRLASGFGELILTQYRENPRAMPVEELAALASEVAPSLGRSVASCPEEAWDLARVTASPGDLICATGSLFLAAEIRGAIEKRPVMPAAQDVLATPSI